MEQIKFNNGEDEEIKLLRKKLKKDILIGVGILIAFVLAIGTRKENWLGYVLLGAIALIAGVIIYRHMERKKALNPVDAEEEELSEEEKAKWYNDKFKLGLSILIFPALIYGIYKTSIIKRNVKFLICAGFAVLCIIAPKRETGGDAEGKRLLHQSAWNNSVPLVEQYIMKNLNDPNSYESVKWGEVGKNADGTYYVLHTFRARNGFGGVITQLHEFTIDHDGMFVIKDVQLE